MTVYVRFADHCFGEHANKSQENPKFIFPWCSSNTKDPRAFSPERYEFSPKLPGYVSTLQEAVVFQSNSRRNFVFQTAESNSKGEYFAFYFNIKKASSSVQHHLEMNVVSCYPSSNHLSALGSKREKIRFKVLCGKIYRGEAVNFN